MAHTISWPVPDRVVLVTLTGGIMADEVQVIADRLYTEIGSTDTMMVHVLIDADQSSIGDKIWNYGKLKLRRNPKVQIVIVIGDSRLSGLIIAIFSKIVNLPIHYRESTDEALKVIGARDLAVSEYLQE